MATTRVKPEKYRDFDVPIPVVKGPDPVGVLEIAGRLGIKDRSVHMIRRRGQLPPPNYTTNGSRAWEWRTILWWAGETKRLRSSALLQDYETTFGRTPSLAPLPVDQKSHGDGKALSPTKRTDDWDTMPPGKKAAWTKKHGKFS